MLVLGAVAGAAVIGYTLYGSDENTDVEAKVFASIDSCVADGESEANCVARYNEAATANTATAPRFSSQADCERDFGVGKCEAAPAGQTASSGTSSYFMPMMMGFMAARMMQGSYPAQPVYGCARTSPMPQASAGCYSNNLGQRYAFTGGSYTTARTTTVPASAFSRSNSANYVSRGSSVSSFRPSGSSSVVARSGFGSSGRGYSGGG